MKAITPLFTQDEDFPEVDVRLPPTIIQNASLATGTVEDLSKLAHVWALIGRGGSGKTTLARWLGSEMTERNALGNTLFAALDPTNRTLAQFFDNVHQPDTSAAADAEAFLRRLVSFTSNQQYAGVWDFGGGDVSLARLIDASPQFDQTMRQAGVGLIAAYVLSPSVDDIASLRSFEERGFQPKATALILNMGKADRLGAFAALRAQPAYKRVLARGGVEIVMPRLDPEAVALDVERKRLQFFQARDGVVPAGSKMVPVDGLDAAMVRSWLSRMDDAFAPVASWLPWI